MKNRPETCPLKAALRGTTAVALLALLPAAWAHDVWIAPLDKTWVLRFGHADSTAAVDTERVRQLAAFDAQGQPLAVRPDAAGGATLLKVDGPPALFTVHLDNGYWSRPVPGAKAQNVAKDKLPAGATGAHTLKFGKTVVQWGELATRAQGQALEIVPLASAVPRAGALLGLQVLHAGQALPGALVKRGEDDQQPLVADAQGRVQLPVAAGWQTAIATHRVPLAGDPRADAVALSATLVFEGR
jgi:nickel transport protein